MTRLTREMILKDRLQMAYHNLECYSYDYLCERPIKGKEAEHKEVAAEVEMLKAWLKEFHSTHQDSTIEFVGHITGWSGGRTCDGHPLAKDLMFEVCTGAGYLYGDRRKFDIAAEAQDWFVPINDKCPRYDHEKYNRPSRLVKITVDRIGYVRTIEWVYPEYSDEASKEGSEQT